ncbi:hypothetical protein [Synechococcus phage Ssp-JY38]|nr:hypothetical protein [Synechococcus phage Yong-L2-223]
MQLTPEQQRLLEGFEQGIGTSPPEVIVIDGKDPAGLSFVVGMRMGKTVRDAMLRMADSDPDDGPKFLSKATVVRVSDALNEVRGNWRHNWLGDLSEDDIGDLSRHMNAINTLVLKARRKPDDADD